LEVLRGNCFSCLPKGLSDEEYEKILKQYIECMDEEIRTPGDIYEKRLLLCGQCEFLRNGICRLCGCFVALRAAKKFHYCADTPARW